jgi:hypothetical protein
MKIPYVIDNQTHRLANSLNELLAEHRGRSLDVATAYFIIIKGPFITKTLRGSPPAWTALFYFHHLSWAKG